MTDRAAPTQAQPEVPSSPPTFDEVFVQNFSYVFHSLRRLGVREGDLEDVAHDVFVVVHRKLHDFDPARPIRPWIFGIAVRTAADYRRLARHQHEVQGEPQHAPADVTNAEDALGQRERQHLVLDALVTLDPDQRAVLVMHDVDGHGMPEIAEALGIPLNTGYSRLRLARQGFASAVRRLGAQRGLP